MKRIIAAMLCLMIVGCGFSEDETSKKFITSTYPDYVYDKITKTCLLDRGMRAGYVKVECTKEFCDLVKGCN